MQFDKQQSIRELLEPLTVSRDAVSWLALFADSSLYIAGVAMAVLAPSPWMKLAASLVAGTAISMLFILGHDANHRTLWRGWDQPGSCAREVPRCAPQGR